MTFKKIISAVILLNHQTAYCELVMPVLYGWYTGIEKEYTDSCHQDHYKYKNLEIGSAFELAQKAFSVQERNDCIWERVILKEKAWYASYDFPGTRDQWESLSKNSSMITQEATRSCFDLNGYLVDSISMNIFPSYRCPNGSVYSLDMDSRGDYKLGCSTKPMGCYADIVGRDLDTKNKDGTDRDKIGIKNLGHIGLTFGALYGPMVLEVLDEDEVIQNNSIDTFKNKTKFWGERYGTQQKNNLELLDGVKILSIASEQYSCSPEYTLTWSFAPCNSGKPAKFRCDSFVYYAYLKGANLDLGYTTLFTYPSTIFNSMLSCRNQLGSNCIQDIPIPELDHINLYVLKPSTIAEKKITAIISEDTIDIKSLDESSRAYIMAKDESRENKINLLWSLLIKYQLNPLKFDYLSDVLSELEPIEKADAIIAAFRKTPDSHLKSKYLTLLMGSMTTNRFNKNPNYTYSTKNFLTNLLQTTQDEDILRALIVSYPESIMDESSYLIMSARLNEQENQNPKYFKKIVTNSNFWYQWLGLANMDKKFNPIWVEKLFRKCGKYSQNEHVNQLQDVEESSPSLLSKEILKAFNFGLKSREKQNKAFLVPQSIKKKNPQLNNMDEAFLSDEIAYTLKCFKEEKTKSNAWKRNLQTNNKNQIIE